MRLNESCSREKHIEICAEAAYVRVAAILLIMPTELYAMLDTLRRQLLALSSGSPYYRPPLRRITQQLEYVVQTWPAEHWPVRLPAPAPALLRQMRMHVPTRPQMLAQLQEISETLQKEEQIGGCQHQLLNLLLCFL